MKIGRLLRAEYTDVDVDESGGSELEVKFEVLDGGLVDRLTLYFDNGFSFEDFYVGYSSSTSFLNHRFVDESHAKAKAKVTEVLPSYNVEDFLTRFPRGFYFNDGSTGEPEGYYPLYEAYE